MGRHDEWVARDAAVVWHGFTQMDAYAENAPILVERGEGHELVDVDGRHYLDAISSLWVNTLGHHVARARRRGAGAARPRRALDDARQRQPSSVVELSEALARVVPVDEPHFLYASDGAAAVEQALKIAFQYWVNRGVGGHTQFLAFGGAYHGDTMGALSVGDGELRHRPLRSAALSRAPRTAVRRPGLLRHRDRDGRDARRRARRGHRRAARAGRGRHAARRPRRPARRSAAACRDARRAPDLRRGRHRLRAHGHPVRLGAVRASVPTSSCSARASPPVTSRCRRPSRAAACSTPSSVPTSGAHAVPRALVLRGTRWPRRSRCATSQLLDEWSVLDNVQDRSRELRALLDDRVAPAPRSRDVRLRGLMGGVELAPPVDGLRWGRRVLCRSGATAACCSDRSATWSCSCRRSPSPRRRCTGSCTRSPARSTRSPRERHTPRLERVGRASRPTASRAPASGGRRGRSIPSDPQGRRLVRVERLPRPHPAPRRASRRRTRPSTAGAPAPARPASSWAPVRCTTSSRPSWRRGSGTEAAVLFSTGFAANLGVLTTFGGPTRWCAPTSSTTRRSSTVAGSPARRSRCTATATLAHVDELLRACETPRAIVVTETVFSMDGDVAPVDKLAEVCAHHGALLVLDEAHAVLGPDPDDATLGAIDAPSGRHAVEDARRARRLRRGPRRGSPICS